MKEKIKEIKQDPDWIWQQDEPEIQVTGRCLQFLNTDDDKTVLGDPWAYWEMDRGAF